jgi:hypothetical protein
MAGHTRGIDYALLDFSVYLHVEVVSHNFKIMKGGHTSYMWQKGDYFCTISVREKKTTELSLTPVRKKTTIFCITIVPIQKST